MRADAGVQLGGLNCALNKIGDRIIEALSERLNVMFFFVFFCFLFLLFVFVVFLFGEMVSAPKQNFPLCLFHSRLPLHCSFPVPRP